MWRRRLNSEIYMRKTDCGCLKITTMMLKGKGSDVETFLLRR